MINGIHIGKINNTKDAYHIFRNTTTSHSNYTDLQIDAYSGDGSVEVEKIASLSRTGKLYTSGGLETRRFYLF